MEGQYIKTATGKEFPVRFFGSIQNGPQSSLYLEIMNSDIATVVNVFNNNDETSCIIGHMSDDAISTYYGYTQLASVNVVMPDRNIKVRLDTDVELR